MVIQFLKHIYQFINEYIYVYQNKYTLYKILYTKNIVMVGANDIET